MTNETKQKVREFYDEIGWRREDDGNYQNARYEDLRPVSREYIHKTRLRVMNGLMPTGRFLLDAGSGPVQYEEYKTYSQGYEKRVCLDISIQALREARNRIGSHGLFVVGDLANLPFKAEAFDGAVSMHAIHHLALTEHPKAYAEIYRALAAGRTAAVVNGWHNPLLIRLAEPLIGWMRALSGRGAKRKREWLDEENPAGTFVQKMTPEWLKKEIGSQMTIEIKPWRSLSTRILRWFVRPFGGRAFLKLVFWLEDAFPKFFAENGQYPLIVIRKP
ncbi:MAG: class I SAM-dependent methyltransferase [Chloroflexi bacterium]|nr:class I SAM-dependent methyltransferase [Chloroflexota bacterium]MCA2001396.1 class I SAM-dependent methyltransferase [Chloroflexota bacterium]